MIKPTTALRKISSLKKRIWKIQGGQGSAKTFSILILLINHALQNSDKEILIVSSELTKMRLTVIKDFIKVIKLMGAYEQNNFLGGTLYRFNNNSFIKFIGLDKADVGKGLRSDIVFFNEVNKIDFDAYGEIASRSKKVIMDYNPNFEFWADTELTESECDKLILTYKDNEYLSAEERNEIEGYKVKGYINPDLENYDTEANTKNRYWRNKWRVYGIGQTGITEGVIFENWETGEFDDSLPYCYGLDLGFFPDPTAMVKVAVDNKAKIIYISEILYSTKLSYEDVYREIQSKILKGNDLIISDTNEPRLIGELRHKGLNVAMAEKYAGSVLDTIKIIQDFKLIITPNSVNMIKELRNYSWHDKKNSVPIGDYDHLISALRYSSVQLIRKNNFTFI